MVSVLNATASLPAVSFVTANSETLSQWHSEFAANPSLLAALPAMTHMLSVPGVPGGLGLQKVGGVLVVAEPLAPSWAWGDLVSVLLSHVQVQGTVPCFGPVNAEFAALLTTLGFTNVRLGSTPYIHLHHWPQRGNSGAGVRHARNRATREKTVFSHIGPGQSSWTSPGEREQWKREVLSLSAEWQKGHRANRPFHWIFDLQPLAFQEIKHYFEARSGGRLVGLIAASPLPGRASWYLEDVLRSRDASAATGTALVSYALDFFQAADVPLVTLGGIPLSRTRDWATADQTSLEKAVYRFRPLLSRLYSFDGLELFKRRFGPAHWEDEYLALPPGVWPRIRVAVAIARLILWN